MKKLSVLALILLLLDQVQLHANPFFDQYSTRYITEAAGLPSNDVHHLIKDSKGYIWAATPHGIARFDGYSFITLKDNYINYILEDDYGNLWIASEDGIDVIDIENLKEVGLNIDECSPLAEAFNENIRTLYKDSKGYIWLASDNNLWCVKADKEKISEYYQLKNLGAGGIHAITETQGKIWAGIDNLICILTLGAEHTILSEALSDENLSPFSNDWRILCMQEDGELLWVGTNRGLFRYNTCNHSLKRYRYSTHRPGMLSQAYITDITLSKGSDLIVSTLNGLNVYNREDDTFSFIRQNSERSNINCNAINCLLSDENNIWLGTENGGINLLTKKSLQVQLSGDYPVNAIAQDRQGNLYIANMENGLSVRDRNNDILIKHQFSPGDVSTISNNTINGLLIDSDNYLWAYTWGVGFNFLDLNIKGNRKFVRYTREEHPGIEGDFTNSACEDLLNRGIWFGTTRGLQFYDKDSQEFQRILLPGEKNEFEAIRALYADHKYRLWAGTTQGLYQIDLHSFASSRTEFEFIKHDIKLNCIFQDDNRDIWMGSDGGGLYLLEENKDGGDKLQELHHTRRSCQQHYYRHHRRQDGQYMDDHHRRSDQA